MHLLCGPLRHAAGTPPDATTAYSAWEAMLATWPTRDRLRHLPLLWERPTEIAAMLKGTIAGRRIEWLRREADEIYTQVIAWLACLPSNRLLIGTSPALSSSPQSNIYIFAANITGS